MQLALNVALDDTSCYERGRDATLRFFIRNQTLFMVKHYLVVSR